MNDILIRVKNINKSYEIKRKIFGDNKNYFKVLNDISLDFERGKTVGLAGESGSGKTTLGRCLIRLTDIESGAILYDGKDIIKYSGKEMRQFRKKVQIIFQDPYSSLNPRMSIGALLKEIIKFHTGLKGEECNKKVLKLLDIVGLKKNSFNKYPNEFSGGQRQRIAIARALAVEPEFIVCDEPVSALDVSVQSQILNLLKSLQKEFNLTYLFISHNLSVIKYIADYTAIMYSGKIVEYADTEKIFSHPCHPYTKVLIDAIPSIYSHTKSEIKNSYPSDIINKPNGCYYNQNCPLVMDICRKEFPPKMKKEDGFVYCHLKQN